MFNIRKDDSEDPNDATITIYNLSEESRNQKIETGQLVYLSAGYEDDEGLDTIFIGNISNISHSLVPPDVVTTITARDGSKDILEKKISLSYKPGVSGELILTKILESFSMSSNFSSIQFTDKQYANGFTFAGPSSKALTKVARFLDLSWSIQDNEIRLVEFDGSDQIRSILLSPSTGLIGSPEKQLFTDRKAKGLSSEDNIPGYRLLTLLQPKVVPNGKVVIQSKEIQEQTEFTVMNIAHNGDTHGSDWNSEIEVKE